MTLARIDRRSLEAHAPRLDRCVALDHAIAPFCSGSAWQLAYHDAFAPERPLLFASRGDDCVLLARHDSGEGLAYLEPLENMWGFASPLIGEGAPALLASALRAEPEPVVLLGLPLDRARLVPMLERLEGRFAARRLAPTTRRVASLRGGMDAWAQRRSSAFRRNLRSTLRRVREAGIRFIRLDAIGGDEWLALYAEVLEIESRTWKSAAGNGADGPNMRAFYEGMWPRLAAAGELRVILAERGGQSVGYLHGGLRRGHFRGLQVSFDDAFRDVSLGNALQLEMIGWLCEVGAHSYDLGAYSAYKSRWAEPGLETFGIVIQPAGP